MSSKTANCPLRPRISVNLFDCCGQASLYYYFILTFIIVYKINTALKALNLIIASFGFPSISCYPDHN